MPAEAPLADPYDLVPYGEHVWPETHPDHLAGIAWMRGLDPLPVERARVLEIGCGNGSNLLPMADALPGARLFGIDRAPEQIAAGEAIRAAAGLSNIELRAADLERPE